MKPFERSTSDINASPELERTWALVLSKLNAESVRHKVRPVPRTGARNDRATMRATKEPRLTQGTVEQ
jgi:hypothetical protein